MVRFTGDRDRRAQRARTARRRRQRVIAAVRAVAVAVDAARYPAYPASSRENDVDALAEGHDPQRVRGPVPLEQRAV